MGENNPVNFIGYEVNYYIKSFLLLSSSRNLNVIDRNFKLTYPGQSIEVKSTFDFHFSPPKLIKEYRFINTKIKHGT